MGYIGIDYGMGTSNIDYTTGIHYGIIHANEVSQAWYDSARPVYGDPACAWCGAAYPEDTDLDQRMIICPECGRETHCDQTTGDDPLYWEYTDDGYAIRKDTDGDLAITASPFYTHCMYCSPCVPGAGYIMSPVDGGIMTYCLGHDWFDDATAPYPVYAVATGAAVAPTTHAS